MTDAVNDELKAGEGQSVDVNKEANVEAPQLSQAEIEAREQGWVPKEDYQGDEHKWVDAGEFLRRGDLFKKIEIQNKEIKEVRKTLQLLSQHNKQIKEAEFKRAIEYLKAQKKEALMDGDADKVVDLDEKLIEAKEQQKAMQQQAARDIAAEVETLHPEFQAWTDRNRWYTNHAHMKVFADKLGAQLAQEGTLSRAKILEEVEKRVKAEFPQRFTNPQREKPGAVEGTSAKGGAKSSGYKPTEFERQVAKRFVQQGVFKNEQEYYKQLEETK